MPSAYASKVQPKDRPHFVKICFSDPEAERTRPAGEDQRRSPRRRVLLSALVVHADFSITFIRGPMNLLEPSGRVSRRLRTLWLGALN
jgi:hypothetical protein